MARTTISITCSLLLFAASAARPLSAAPSDLDPTFGNGGVVEINVGTSSDIPTAMIYQPDGNIVLAGRSLAQLTGYPYSSAVRFLPTGEIDNSFGNQGVAKAAIRGEGSFILGASEADRQSDGKIVLVSTISSASAADFALQRLLPNGQPDLSFGTTGSGVVIKALSPSFDSIRAIAIQDDDKIVLAGYTGINSNSDFVVLRYLPDGTPDDSFGDHGLVVTSISALTDIAECLCIQSDGKILAAGSSSPSGTKMTVVRYLADGSLDPTFGENGIVTVNPLIHGIAYELQVAGDGSILLAGVTDTYYASMIKLRENGSLDTSFGTQGKATARWDTATSVFNSMKITASGKIIASGHFRQTTNGDIYQAALMCFLPNGTLDSTFGTAGKVKTSEEGTNSLMQTRIALANDGGILFSSASGITGPSDFTLFKYSSTGVLDPAFGNQGVKKINVGNASNGARALGIQPDGKLLSAGYTFNAGVTEMAFLRFLPNGSPDLSFGVQGRAKPYQGASSTQYPDAQALQVASDGSILLSGSAYTSNEYYSTANSANAATWRFNSTGMVGELFTQVLSLDRDAILSTVLQSDGTLFGVGPAADGAIYDFAVLKNNALDPRYPTSIGPENKKTNGSGSFGTASPYGVGVQSTQRLIVGGYGTTQQGKRTPLVIGYHTDLTIDTTFGKGGRVTMDLGESFVSIHDMVIQKDDRIVLAGRLSVGTRYVIALFRLLPNGDLDTTFGANGMIIHELGTQDLNAERIVLQSDGKLVVGGYAGSYGMFVGRFHADGSPDEAFAPEGITLLPLSGMQIPGDGVSVLSSAILYVYGSGRSMLIQPDGKIVLSLTGTKPGERDSDVLLMRLQGGETGAALAVQNDQNSFLTSGNSTAFFGQPEPAATSSITFTIRNSGTSAISNLSASLLGSAMADYTVQSPPVASLAPGASTAVTLSFQPSQSGARAALLRINGTGTGFQPFEVSLLGLGSSPALEIRDDSNTVLVSSKSSLPFGHVLKEHAKSQTITLKNVGTLPLANLQAVLDPSSSTAFTLGSLPVTTLAPSESTTLEISFSPADTEQHTAGLTISTSGTDSSTSEISVTGNGRDLFVGEKVIPFGLDGVASLSGPSGSITSVLTQEDGKVLVTGYGSNSVGIFLARYLPDGTPDPSFGTDSFFRFLPPATSSRRANATALQPDGKIVVVGYLFRSGAPDGLLIFRCLSNGTLDTSFGTNGWTVTDLGGSTNDQAFALLILPDGKILTGARKSGFRLTLLRYLSNGILDSTFGTAGVFTSSQSPLASAAPCSFALQADGKIVIAYSNSPYSSPDSFQITRNNPNGSLDTTFDVDGILTVTFFSPQNDSTLSGGFTNLAIQPDGKILAAGTAGRYFALARLNSNGALDTTFGGSGKILTKFSPLLDVASGHDFAHTVSLQADGKIVLAGYSNANASTSNDLAVARFTTAGALDPTFHGDGKLTLDVGTDADDGYATMLTDGRIAVAGALSGGGVFLTTLYTGLKPQLTVEQISSTAVASGSTVTFDTTGLAQPTTFPLRIRNTGYAHLSGLGSSFSGPHSGDFAASMATPYLAPGRTLDLNLQFTPTALGARTGTMTLLSNDDSAGPFTLALSGNAIASGDAWRQQFFGSTANAGFAADSMDADNDGLTNLLEFATFSDPAQGAPIPAKMQPDGESLYYDYQRDRSALTELIFIVEWSDTLGGGDWHTENVTETLLSDNGRVQQVRATLPKGIEGRRFVRLRVVRPSL